MRIKAGNTYTFTKSGNRVRAIAPADAYMGRPMWVVARVDGAAAGKTMQVPAAALERIRGTEQ